MVYSIYTCHVICICLCECVCICTDTDMYVSIQHCILSILVRVRWGANTIHTERVHSGFVTVTLKSNAAWVGSNRTRQVMRIKDWLWEYRGYCVEEDDSSIVILKCLQNGVTWRLTTSRRISCLLTTRLKNNLGTATYLLAWLTKWNCTNHFESSEGNPSQDVWPYRDSQMFTKWCGVEINTVEKNFLFVDNKTPNLFGIYKLFTGSLDEVELYKLYWK